MKQKSVVQQKMEIIFNVQYGKWKKKFTKRNRFDDDKNRIVVIQTRLSLSPTFFWWWLLFRENWNCNLNK